MRLFSEGVHRVSLNDLSKKTRIPERTLNNYRKDERTIPLGRLRLIVKALELSDAEIVELIRGKKK